MIIPHTDIQPQTLRALLEEFITREGTDYGETEIPLEQKVAQLQRQLDAGDIVIVFDPALESTSVVPAREVAEGNNE